MLARPAFLSVVGASLVVQVATPVAADPEPPVIYCLIAGSGAFHPALHAAQVVSNERFSEAFIRVLGLLARLRPW
jgi:hypothetical protein